MPKRRNMIKKEFGVHFFSEGGALTLPVSYVSSTDESYGNHSNTHKSGWTINEEIREDYYTWVNDFKAEHPDYGRVYGNFEKAVYATSELGFEHFMKNHPPIQ